MCLQTFSSTRKEGKMLNRNTSLRGIVMNLWKRILAAWTPFEMAWLTIFIGTAIALSLIWGDTIFALSVFVTGVICVVLVAKANIWNYAFGTYNVAGYVVLSVKNGFFGEVMLNAGYFLPMQLIGWLAWRKNTQGAVVTAQRQTVKQMLLWMVIAGIVTVAYGFFLKANPFQKLIAMIPAISHWQVPGQSTPFFDSCSTVLSVIAMILMVKRYAEQWIYWIVIDVVSVAMWVTRWSSGVEGAVTMTVMWSAYLVNAVYGYIVWLRESKGGN